MSRMCLIGLVLPLSLAGLVAVYGLLPASQITMEIDVYEFRDQWLEGVECDKGEGARYLILEDIEAFFLRTALDSPIRHNVYSRPKESYASGTPVPISYTPWDSAVNPPESLAWMSTKPCRFAATPTVRRWSGKVNLALEFDSIDCKKSQVQVVVPDDRAVLVFLEDLAPGVRRAVWIEPRIVKSDCEWRLHDWLLKLTPRLNALGT